MPFRYIAIEGSVEDDAEVPPVEVAARATLESLVGTAPLAAPDPAVLRPIEDDRDDIQPGDRVLLIIEDDLAFARIMLGLAHENGYKAVVSTRGDSGLALANQLYVAVQAQGWGKKGTHALMLALEQLSKAR